MKNFAPIRIFKVASSRTRVNFDLTWISWGRRRLAARKNLSRLMRGVDVIGDNRWPWEMGWSFRWRLPGIMAAWRAGRDVLLGTPIFPPPPEGDAINGASANQGSQAAEPAAAPNSSGLTGITIWRAGEEGTSRTMKQVNPHTLGKKSDGFHCASPILRIALYLPISFGIYLNSILIMPSYASSHYYNNNSLNKIQGAMSTADIRQRGVSLRDQLSAACSTLINKGEVSAEGNDLSGIVSAYIPVGTSFSDAENILRAAGFEVGPKPKSDFIPKSYAVVGVITTFNNTAPERFDLYVDLYPKVPYLFTFVDSLTASFYVSLP
jgi:hypothetical protein